MARIVRFLQLNMLINIYDNKFSRMFDEAEIREFLEFSRAKNYLNEINFGMRGQNYAFVKFAWTVEFMSCSNILKIEVY
jgi:hypothetical protein